MKKLIIIIALAAVVSGCGTVGGYVPSTEFSATLNGHPAKFKGPKNFSADKVEFSADTNGTVKLEMTNVKAVMDPDVISMTGEAYAKMRTADAAVVQSTISGTASLIQNLPK